MLFSRKSITNRNFVNSRKFEKLSLTKSSRNSPDSSERSLSWCLLNAFLNSSALVFSFCQTNLSTHGCSPEHFRLCEIIMCSPDFAESTTLENNCPSRRHSLELAPLLQITFFQFGTTNSF